MQLTEHIPTIEQSDKFETISYSCNDLGFIFDILRNKLYSNKILAVVREISTNARDSHREFGNAHVPIEITFPNMWSSVLKIKDFGTGMSEETIKNTFASYGSSSKRHSNLLHGAYGIGASSIFSITDSFTITTTVNNIKYTYAAFIDPSKIGKISLLDQEPTSEPNGTEIIIPIKQNDFPELTVCAERVFKHWDRCKNSVRPTIIGQNFQYKEYKFDDFLIKGEDYEIISQLNSYNQNNINVIIDGVPYNLDRTSLPIHLFENFYNVNLNLFLGIGEVNVSANRESINIDDKCKEILTNKIKCVKQDIINFYTTKINESKNFVEVYKIVNQLKNYFSQIFKSNFYDKSWNNIKFSSNLFESISLIKPAYEISLTPAGKIIQYKNYRLRDFEQLFLVNDTGSLKVSSSVLKKISTTLNVKKFLVIDPKDLDTSLLEIKDYLNKRFVSEFHKNKKTKGKISIFKLDHLMFKQSSLKELVKDTNKKFYIDFQSFHPDKIYINGKNHLNLDVINSIRLIFPNCEFYCSKSFGDKSFDYKKIPKLENLDFCLFEFIKNNINLKDIETCLYNEEQGQELSRFNTKYILEKIDKNSFYAEFFDIQISVKKTDKKIATLIKSVFPELLSQPIKKLSYKDFYIKYPMLAYIGYLDYFDCEKMNSVINYVNLMEKNK